MPRQLGSPLLCGALPGAPAQEEKAWALARKFQPLFGDFAARKKMSWNTADDVLPPQLVHYEGHCGR